MEGIADDRGRRGSLTWLQAARASHIRRVVVLALLVLACALAAGGIYWFRAHRAAGPSNLVLYLPAANASVIYIDVDALRKSGILNLVAGSKAVEDADYKQFLNDTKFDYRQDLDTVAAAFKDGKVYFALRGRFHWANLKDYAVRQGGSCHDEFCVLPGSQPTRRISFYPLKPDVMAMAIGPDDFGAYQVSSKAQGLAPVPPKEPVWALIPAIELQRMDSLPAAARAYVPALQGAEQIVFSVSADANKQLQLGVQATCKDPTAASTLLGQFENYHECAAAAVGESPSKGRSSRSQRRSGGGVIPPKRSRGVWCLANSAGSSRRPRRRVLEPEVTVRLHGAMRQ